MKTQIRPLLTLFVLLALITGVFYPLLVTGLSQLIFPFQANGSLIKANGQVAGSELIGQYFSEAGYFWGRPSATSTNPYNSFDRSTLTGSGGSNLGPLSQDLIDNVQNRVSILRKSNPANTDLIPVDLINASASGLDPHISVAAAYYQAERIANARKTSIAEITSLIDKFTEQPLFGFIGEVRVNVLKLNLALDGLEYK
jgi:potassium-transporting ATPase KdpC subunit